MRAGITINGAILPCWKCPECGCRIYPLAARELHEKRHQKTMAKITALVKGDPTLGRGGRRKR